MLQAKSKEGLLTTLTHLSRVEIEYYRKNLHFFCPVCDQPVIIKAGKMVTPHFAHHLKAHCPSNQGGESTYHEKGKLMLYQWLKSQGLNVLLEKYISEIKQQPDLLLTIKKKQIAIEFQCARISIQQIQLRNNGYKQAGITPIWILGANRFKRRDSNSLKIDQFTMQFIHQFSPSHPLKIFYFCPDTLQFLTFQDVFVVQIGRALGQFKYQKLNEMIFTDLFNHNKMIEKKIFTLFKREKRRFRLQLRKTSFGKERAWQQYLYLKQTHLEYLPAIVFLPVSHQFKMKGALWDWQSRLCLDVIEPLQVGQQFTLKKCESLLRRQCHPHHYFSLVCSIENPIKQYLQLLTKLKYIEERSSNTYTKIINIRYHRHVDESLHYDECILNELILKI